MKEHEIRSREAHSRYLELVRLDAEELARDESAFSAVACPACGATAEASSFVKLGFRYAECADCETLFVNPRPNFDRLAQLYADSPSTRYWIDSFFKPMVPARREKIFRPRAQFISDRFPELSGGRIGDIGAGFGLFLEELRTLWPAARLMAIEPSSDMAAILRRNGLEVIEAMLEDVPRDQQGFDLLTAFELFEHLHDPIAFLRSAGALLRPGGLLFLTTLNGQGFDVQILWERSKSVSPPHHLNFINPQSAARLLERAGYEVVSIDTPGQLDVDIVEGVFTHENTDPGRFMRTVIRHGTPAAKTDLQRWVREHNFSSHIRMIARKPAS